MICITVALATRTFFQPNPASASNVDLLAAQILRLDGTFLLVRSS
jgi:hypothetical protein